MKVKKILVSIPAYNEEETLQNVIPHISKKIEGYNVDILVVDDGSSDNTSTKAKELGADFVIKHDYNKGVGAGFSSALEFFLQSDYSILVTIDADGQFEANDIPKLVIPILHYEADLSIASRYEGILPINMPSHKYILNRWISNLVGRMMSKKVGDLTCGFRAYSRESLYQINLFSPYTYTQEVIIEAISKRLRIARIPTRVTYFSDRKSRVVNSILGYISKSVTIIIRTVRDARPLLFFGIPGMMTMLLGLLFGFIFLYKYLLSFKTTPYRTWFFISGFLLISGLLMLFMGLMSDMLKRNRKITEENLRLTKKLLYKDENNP